jgi:hypothetical protein
MAYWGMALSAAGDYRPAFVAARTTRPCAFLAAAARTGQHRRDDDPADGHWYGDAPDPARENIAKAMTLRDKVTERAAHIESQNARRHPSTPGAGDGYVMVLRTLVQVSRRSEAKSMLGPRRSTASSRSANVPARTR